MQVKKVTWHIPSKCQKEMVTKSEVVTFAFNAMQSMHLHLHMHAGPFRCAI